MQEAKQKFNMKKTGKNILHILIWILAISLYMAFNYIPQVGIVIILMLAVSLALSGKSTLKREWITTGIIILCLLLGMMTKRYSFRMILVTAVSASALFTLIMDTKAKKQAEIKQSRVGAAFGAIGYVLSGLICAFLLFNVLHPDALIKIMQNGAADYPDNVTAAIENKGNATVYRDVTYDSEYPNSTYTVYSLPDSKGVFFSIHGGGLVLGDKESDAQNVYLFSMIDAGYSVVTVDYVLAPQNPFPQSVRQVNDALAYFIRHVDDYGLTADRIIVGGDSAGGMLSGLLAVINTNSEYAQELGVTAAVEGTDVTLKGYISISGLVDVPRFSNSGQFLIDWIFDTMARSAFQDADYAYTDNAHLGSVLEHVTADFPPAYCSDGNCGSFGDQNKDLVERLTDLGVPVDYNFPDRDVATLYHIWDLDASTELGEENFKRTVAFMDEFMR